MGKRSGNLLLNVGPKGDGSIPGKDKRILKEIGQWLKENGEAIYGTYPWRKYAEGPTRLPEGHFSDQKEMAYTGEDIRFTAKGRNIYAIVMSWPPDGEVVIRSMAKQSGQATTGFHGLIGEVRILGEEQAEPLWYQGKDGLHVKCRLCREMPVVIGVGMR